MSGTDFKKILCGLTKASEKYWPARMALDDLFNQYTLLPIQIPVTRKQISKLLNNCIERRELEIGLDSAHPDFWDADMIIALYE